MGTFIINGATELASLKEDASTPSGAPTEWAATDLNKVRAALLDLRDSSRQVVNVKTMFGAVGNGVTDDTAAINAALASLSGVGGTVFFPPGTYIVAPAADTTWIKVPAGVEILGCGDSSVIKVPNGNAAYYRIFGAYPATTSDASNVKIRNIKIDQNSPNVAAVALSSTAAAKAVSFFAGTDIVIDNIWVANGCGIDHLDVNGSTCSRIYITNNRLHFLPRTVPATYDNTCIYVDATESVVTGNILYAAAGSGALGGCEMHRPEGLFANNRTKNYANIVRAVTQISGTDTGKGDITITGNSGTGCTQGIDLWAVTGYTMKNVVVTGNVIHVGNADQYGTTAAVSYHGIMFQTDPTCNGDFHNVLVADNTIELQTDTTHTIAGEYLSGGIICAPNGAIYESMIINNSIRNSPTQGITLNPGGGSRGVRIAGNRIIDSGHNTAATYRIAMLVSGVCKNNVVEKNDFIDTGGTMKGDQGLYFAPTATSAGNIVRDNRFWTVSGTKFNHTGDLTYTTEREYRSITPGTITPDALVDDTIELSATTATGFTLNAPINEYVGKILTFRVRNSYGSMGTITWNAAYKKSTWTNPANGFSRTIQFQCRSAAAWVQITGAGVDVAN